jgi:hypothetical protein
MNPFYFIREIIISIDKKLDAMFYEYFIKKINILPIAITDGKKCIDYDMDTTNLSLQSKRKTILNMFRPLDV